MKKDDLDLDFKEYWLALKRRWIPATVISSFVLGLTSIVLLTQKSAYEAKGKLLIKPDEIPSLAGLELDQSDLEPLTLQSNPLKTEIEIIRSKPVMAKVIEAIELETDNIETTSISSIRSGLEIDIAGGTDILEIIYSDPDPERAADIVNATMSVYIKTNIELNQAEAVSARQFIAEELPKAEAALQTAESELSLFKENNQLVNIDEESRSMVNFVTELNQQLAEVQAQLANTDARLLGLQEKVGMSLEQAIDLSVLSQSEGVREVLSDLQAVENELAKESTFFQDSSPQIQDLENRRVALQEILRQRVASVVGNSDTLDGANLQIGQLEQGLIDAFVNSEIQKLGLSNQISALQEIRAEYIQRLGSLPNLERIQRDLQRRLDVAQTNYEDLLVKLQEVKAVENQTLGNARIIETASIPSDPVLSKKAIALALMGVVTSATLFGITVILLEALDSSLKSSGKIKELLKLPVLEEIPMAVNNSWKFNWNQKLVGRNGAVLIQDMPFSPISNLYRRLQMKLKFQQLGAAPKVIVVSSSVPEEGKSVVSANLALVTADLGEKVLLIDANIRQPSQHMIWNIPNKAGLSDLLTEDSAFETAVRSVNPELDILTIGSKRTDLGSVLNPEKMAQMINQVSQEYRWIIIDTPPILFSPDPLTLSQITNGNLLMVVRYGFINSDSALAVRELFDRTNQRSLGMVLYGAEELKDSSGINYQSYLDDEYSSLTMTGQEPAVNSAVGMHN